MAHEKPHQKLINEGETALKNPDVRPEEVEDWYRKKGMDKPEAKEAINIWKHSKGAQEWDKMQKAGSGNKAAGQTGAVSSNSVSKKSYGLWFIIFLLVILGAVYYLYRAGLIRF